jgi:phosphohistidine phosphatase SixA
MKKLTIRIAVLIFALAGQLATAQQAGRTIFLVRHGEAASTAPTASLTPMGETRAECLARTLADANIKQIYVSDSKRTQQTAAPLAAQLKLNPTVVAGSDISTLVRNLMYGTGNVLVVGQNDTVPLLIQRLQAGKVGGIAETDFDRLFVVAVTEGAATPVSTLRYCEPGVPATAAPKKIASARLAPNN